MRISILSGGAAGSVAVMQKEITRLDRSIENTIDDLRELNRKIRKVNGGMNGTLENATAHINARISEEEAKHSNLVVASQRIGTFLDNTIQTDAAVARRVEQNQKALLQEFPWLRPKDANKNPSFWAQLASSWDKFWGNVGDWVSDLVGNIVDYLKENAVELIIGLVCIAVAAVLICLTGGAALTFGAFLAAFAEVLATTVISALTGAAVTGAISWLTGGSFWEAFGDDFATGFMIGGIFAAVGSAITALSGAIRKMKLVDDVAGGIDDIVNGVDEIVPGSVDIPDRLPEYRKAELRALNEKGGYDQLSFLDGKRVPYGTSGSTRPDVIRVVFDHLEAVEVKYYDLSKRPNCGVMYKELLREVTERTIHLPPGSTQRIVLDVTGRGFDPDLVYKVVGQVAELLDNVYPNIPIEVVGLL